ncbi:MAG: hypothetical protein IPK26_31000 [Planctomycetes bacterium]|nr:hypothetical protein [Planctomycetota bacterium]
MRTRLAGRAMVRLLVVASSLPAAAQNITVPAAMNGVEGGTGSNIPFGTNQGVRFQCLYDREDLPWSGPRVLSGISFRADNPIPGTTTYAAKQFLIVDLRMSTTDKTAATAVAEFEDNFGSDVTAVMGLVPVALPAQPAVAGVRPANIDFVFTVPWVYGLTPARDPRNPPPGSLLFDLTIRSQPVGTYRLDNLAGCTAPQATFGNQGPACAALGAAPLDLRPAVSMEAGLAYSWQLLNVPANAPFYVFLNLTAQGSVFGQPLPLALFDPANPGLPNPVLSPVLRYPAPDCWVNLEPGAGLLGTADASGVGSVSVPLPAGRQFVGMTLFAQAFAYAQTANPLQVITSFGKQSTVCGPLGAVRIYQTFPTNGTVPLVGTLQRGQGAIFEVR